MNAQINMPMVYDYSKLLAKLKEFGKTQADLASAIHITEAALNRKLKSKTQFKQTEMIDALTFLGEPIDLIEMYFFCRKTCENAS